MIEKLFFNILAFALFILIFFRMARKNDTKYVLVLFLEAIGITLNFVELNYNTLSSVPVKIIEYILSVVLPLVVILLEKYAKITFSEIIMLVVDKYYTLTNNTEGSKQNVLALIERNKESVIAYKLLAKAYEKEGEKEKALDEYIRIIGLNNKDIATYFKVVTLLNELDRKEEAEETLTLLLEEEPSSYEATIMLGEMLYNRENFKEAADVYNRALKYNPNDYDLYYNLGMVYIRLNDFVEAMKCYETAAEINKKGYNSYFILGKLSLISNDVEQSEKYFSESLYGEEVEAIAYYEMAKIYMIKNQKEMAITFIKKAIEIDSTYEKIAKSDVIFIPIKQYINKEEVQDKVKKDRKLLSQKELDIIEKLNHDIQISQKLGYKEIFKTGEKYRDNTNVDAQGNNLDTENKNKDLTI